MTHSSPTLWATTLCQLNTTTNCAGGFGHEEYIFQDTINLPQSGVYKFYRVDWQGNSSFPEHDYVEAYINIQPGLNNHLPDFTSNPEFQFCVTVPVMLQSFATEPDGDSMVYSIIPLMSFDTISQTGINYIYTPPNSPFDFLLYMPPATIDPSTGTVYFTPPVIAIGAMAIKVDEYRNSVWTGSVMRVTDISSTGLGISISVNENKITSISFYPNPASEIIYLKSEELIQDYEITDVSGRIFFSGKINDDSSINISKLSNGVFLLHLKTQNKNQTFKLIKNN
ncbi:MAG: T9SS type A sorting domain-containing protein [Bacteroidota bacterium]